MSIAHFIDHTVLKPDCSPEDIKTICSEAVIHGFKAVCIPPYFVPKAVNILEGTPVKVCTVVGFPMGYSTTASKVEEIKRALAEGADEVDVVVNVNAIKDGNWNFVSNDIDATTTAIHIRGKAIKIIFETGLLTEEEIVRLCEICNEKMPDFVKTSTGWNGGATSDIVKLLRENLNSSIKIKASGGIRTPDAAHELINAGALRLGTSSGVHLVS